MKTNGFRMFLAALCWAGLAWAAVPELARFVPDAGDYELICSFNPLDYHRKGYAVDNTDAFSGVLKRLGYFLSVTDRQGRTTWAFAAMDPFTQDLGRTGVPWPESGVQQTYVDNLEVLSNSPGVATGRFARGNIEFWSNNYGGGNLGRIPGAGGAYDFGDHPSDKQGYGSMQIHNFLRRQTVIAFNHFAGGTCDLGIGNAPEGHPDWTFSQSGKDCQDARMMVVGKFEGFRIRKVVRLDMTRTHLRVTTGKVSHSPGEPIVFACAIGLEDQPLPGLPYFVQWTRTGDDGRTESRKDRFVPGKPLEYTTSLDRPGFVRVVVRLLDGKGRQPASDIKRNPTCLECGAGVEIDRIQPAVEEPSDFDGFWKRQRDRLAAVPLKYTMDRIGATRSCGIYAVSVACAGPRPVTGYLTIPLDAKERSLPASASYHGYGTTVQRAPRNGPRNRIHFDVNAHGFDLGRDDAYYQEFFAGIKSGGNRYAFDPRQNSDPETAYFNGMALRVMRSLQFLKALPQWNGKDLKVSGGSQGGLQTIWAAALDPDVTGASSSITWCCDLAGSTAGRLDGWHPQYVPALRYYDAVFHGRRVRCATVIARAGLGDYTCPPSGLAALYNNLGAADKRINWYQGSTHGYIPPAPQIFTIPAR